MSVLRAVARAFCDTHGHKFVDRVGVGGFKETFHVILATGESQALKVYQPGFSPERTSREISAMQRCSHPNIAKLSSISMFYYEGAQYLLSLEEFLDGGTLSARVERGLLSRDEIRAIGPQLMSAVAHIASHGLVHRDLKPENILFRADAATPVIVDFGIVRDLLDTSLTRSWLIQGPGTPFFAPPEQLRNEKAMIDWRSDQFSLGIVLTLAAFGFHPYAEDGATPQHVVERVANRGPQAARFLDAANGAGMPVLIRMTAAWPVERFRTPDELQRAWAEETR